MRMRGICTESMENLILEELAKSRNAQAVLYWYEDDALYDRNGFSFEKIQLTENSIDFYQKGEAIHSISFTNFPNCKKLNDFSNFYQFWNGNNKLTLYIIL